MAIPDLDLKRIRGVLEAYCEAKVPHHVRDKVTMGFSVRAGTITLFERRPSFRAPHAWVEEPIARFRYLASTSSWTLYCMHGNLTWRKYIHRGPAKRFETLLAEVDSDPTCIFWG